MRDPVSGNNWRLERYTASSSDPHTCIWANTPVHRYVHTDVHTYTQTHIENEKAHTEIHIHERKMR